MWKAVTAKSRQSISAELALNDNWARKRETRHIDLPLSIQCRQRPSEVPSILCSLAMNLGRAVSSTHPLPCMGQTESCSHGPQAEERLLPAPVYSVSHTDLWLPNKEPLLNPCHRSTQLQLCQAKGGSRLEHLPACAPTWLPAISPPNRPLGRLKTRQSYRAPWQGRALTSRLVARRLQGANSQIIFFWTGSACYL